MYLLFLRQVVYSLYKLVVGVVGSVDNTVFSFSIDIKVNVDNSLENFVDRNVDKWTFFVDKLITLNTYPQSLPFIPIKSSWIPTLLEAIFVIVSTA